MSVFESDNNAETNILEQLVGEGKKFATVEDALKGKVEADRTIADRNRELAEMREEMNRLREQSEILRRQVTTSREPAAIDTPRDADRPVEDRSNEIDLATRIREELRQAQEEDQKRLNIGAVASKLVEVYGTEDKANEVVKAKAAELGVSVEFLQDVAAKSPKAFFSQIGLTDSTPATATATRSDVNAAALANTSTTGVKDGTYKFYENIRKSDPKLYFSAQVQNKMFADAKRLGDAFYT